MERGGPMSVLVLNGPNLNLLGQRQPEIYGHSTLDEIEAGTAALAAELGLVQEWRQSNHEGVLIDWVQAARAATDAIIVNPGAFSHSSIALLDALNAYDGPVIEVHLSNIHKREAFRHHSFVSQRADAVIAGCGAGGYALALRHVAQLLGRDRG
ncbi:MAG: type II 3-dehydroquinate dehydratase [Pseudomonadota bacterium]